MTSTLLYYRSPWTLANFGEGIVARDYDVDIKTLCYTVLHFEFRHLWHVGIQTIDEVEHFLPGIGSRHRYVLENGKTALMYISSFVYDPEGKTIFSETNARIKVLCALWQKKPGIIPAG